MCKPLYVSETVSAERRGTVLALFAPAIAVGILLAQSWPAFLLLFVDERPPLDGEVLPSYHYDDAHVPGRPSAGWVWRVQLLTGTIPPGIILAIALLAMPESPVFLKAQAARASVRASASASPGRPGPPSSRNAASAVSDVSSLLPAVPDGALGLISTPGAGRAAAFAVMLGVTQQGTGVVAVVLFGTTLLSSAADAFGGKLETWMALVVPAANLGGAIAGAALIDVIGRRKVRGTAKGGRAGDYQPR
jgi:MFS family permease